VIFILEKHTLKIACHLKQI